MSRRKSRPQSLCHPAYWLTWVGIGLLWLTAQMPHRLRLALGRALGILLYHVARNRRHIATVNIDLCFPELDTAARRRLVRETMISNITGLLETALGWWGSDRHLRRMVRVEGLENVVAAKAQGRGVLLLGAHFTTLDFAGRLVSLFIEMDVIYRESKNVVIEHIIRKGRESVFGHVIERSDMRTVLRRLKAGDVVWYAPDQDYGRKHSVFAPFFGVTAATITGTARLARMNDSPVVFLTHYREPDGSYLLQFLKIPAEFPSGDDVADATLINHEIEMAIRRCPDQYMWVHRRFKTQPEGKALFYKRH